MSTQVNFQESMSLIKNGTLSLVNQIERDIISKDTALKVLEAIRPEYHPVMLEDIEEKVHSM